LAYIIGFSSSPFLNADIPDNPYHSSAIEREAYVFFELEFFISVLRFRRDHYLPKDAKAINYDSVSLCEKCFQQRDLDLTTIAKSREEPFGFLRSFNSDSKREACECCSGWRLLATAV